VVPGPERRAGAYRSLNLAQRRLFGPAREHIREGLWPIIQTTVAAVGAYALALLVLPQDRPVFAPVAAIVALGASFGQRGRRAVELVLGIVLGIAVGELLITLVGTGLVQIGSLVFLAMFAAVAVGGGPVLVSQAGISALFLAVLEPVDPGSSPNRVLESLVGGGVALAVNALLFPPNPVRMVGRATRAALEDLAHVLDMTAEALEADSEDGAMRALRAARTVDEQVDALDDAIEVGWETARYTTVRRTARGPLESYEEEGKQIDLAVRNARVLARNVLRYVRRHGEAPPGLADAIRGLGAAVRLLCEASEDPMGERGLEARRVAAEAARAAGAVFAEHGDLATSAIVSQIRSTAVDIVRASEIESPAPDHSFEAPTEELLAPQRPGEGGPKPPPSPD
jgi:uncharacterized membrane protein YgaE (UPF0421/DUF939 family)